MSVPPPRHSPCLCARTPSASAPATGWRFSTRDVRQRSIGRRSLHLVAKGNLERGRSVAFHVHGGWAPGPLLALEACRFPPRLLALLLAHPSRRPFELREEEHGGARAEQRGRGEPPAAALAAQGEAAAAVQRISRDLHHCGCLDESADFHARNLATAAAGAQWLRSSGVARLLPADGQADLRSCGVEPEDLGVADGALHVAEVVDGEEVAADLLEQRTVDLAAFDARHHRALLGGA